MANRKRWAHTLAVIDRYVRSVVEHALTLTAQQWSALRCPASKPC